MNPQEQDRLMRLVERIAGQAAESKEPAAVSALAQLLRRRPDAAYWLLRRCLLLETAIEQALPPEDAPPARPGSSRATPADGSSEPVLRELLGEFTNTSLLADLAEPGEPPPQQSRNRPPPLTTASKPVLRDLLGEFTNTSLLGDLADLPEPASPPRDAPGGPRRS